jgi:hypothetical protein
MDPVRIPSLNSAVDLRVESREIKTNLNLEIERTASGYGTKISGQPAGLPAGKAQASAARRTALTRSNSSPPSSKPGAAKGGSGVPLGANKYPGGNKATGASKQITGGAKSTVGGAKSTVGGIAGRSIGGATGGAQKAIGGASLPKPYPQKAATSTSASTLPKPYPGNNSSNEKKIAVRPGGRPKPFTPPQPNNTQGKSRGKGGGNYPGAGSKTPVQQHKKYKAMPTLQGTAERGKVQHISV